jgi:hypothetical protein
MEEEPRFIHFGWRDNPAIHDSHSVFLRGELGGGGKASDQGSRVRRSGSLLGRIEEGAP